MAGHDAGNEQPFPGIVKYFSLYTKTGRNRCLAVTFASIAGIFLFFANKPKKQPAVTEQ